MGAEEPWFVGLEERRRRLKRGLEGARKAAAALDPGEPEARPEPAEEPELEPEVPKRRAFAPHGLRRPRPSPALLLRRRQTVSHLLARGLCEEDVEAACLEPKHGLGFGTRAQVRRCVAEVLEGWAQQDARQQPRLKSMARRRIHDELQKFLMGYAVQVPAEPVEPGGRPKPPGQRWIAPNPQAAARLEALLAEIEGTREPMRVEVDLSQAQRAAIAGALAAMTPERVLEMAERMRELRAEHERRLLERGSITVEAEVAKALEEEKGQRGEGR